MNNPFCATLIAHRQGARSSPCRTWIWVVLTMAVLHSVTAVGLEKTLTFSVNGVDRSAVVYAPESIQPDAPVPLVLAFHGSSWNGRIMQQTTQFSKLADQEGFIVAYPNGSGPSNILSWNAEFCCSFALERGTDDLGFVDQLLEELMIRYPIDPSRIYATGFSNGGMFTYMLALKRPEILAAVAVVSGAMVASQQPTHMALPILIIHGTEDTVIPYHGGWGALRALSGKTEPAISAAAAAEFWIANNGCTRDASTTSRERTARITRYGECRTRAEVTLITLLDGGHQWAVVEQNPSNFLLTDDAVDLFTVLADNEPSEELAWDVFEVGLDASQTIWEFFESHPSSDVDP